MRRRRGGGDEEKRTQTLKTEFVVWVRTTNRWFGRRSFSRAFSASFATASGVIRGFEVAPGGVDPLPSARWKSPPPWAAWHRGGAETHMLDRLSQAAAYALPPVHTD